MKQQIIFLTIIVLLISIGSSCKKKYKECEYIDSNKQMAIHNDILTEIVEKHTFNRYLGEEAIKIQEDFATNLMDSSKHSDKIISLQNGLFNNPLKFKTVFIVDTILPNFRKKLPNQDYFFQKYFVEQHFGIQHYDQILSPIFNKMSSDKKCIIDSLNFLQIHIPANKFHACTFKIKSIKEFQVTDYNTEIGIIELSKIFLNKEKNEGALSCSYQCGEPCGKGYVFHIKKIENHWKIIDFEILWLS